MKDAEAAESDVSRFRVGQTVLVPCEVVAIDPTDEVYSVKVRIPDGVQSGRDERWLKNRDLAAIKAE